MLEIDVARDELDRVGLDSEKDEALERGDPKDVRRSLFDGANEEMLDRDVAGDDGTEGLGIEKEGGLDGGRSTGAKVKFLKEVSRDVGRV